MIPRKPHKLVSLSVCRSVRLGGMCMCMCIRTRNAPTSCTLPLPCLCIVQNELARRAALEFIRVATLGAMERRGSARGTSRTRRPMSSLGTSRTARAAVAAGAEAVGAGLTAASLLFLRWPVGAEPVLSALAVPPVAVESQAGGESSRERGACPRSVCGGGCSCQRVVAPASLWLLLPACGCSCQLVVGLGTRVVSPLPVLECVTL